VTPMQCPKGLRVDPPWFNSVHSDNELLRMFRLWYYYLRYNYPPEHEALT